VWAGTGVEKPIDSWSMSARMMVPVVGPAYQLTAKPNFDSVQCRSGVRGGRDLILEGVVARADFVLLKSQRLSDSAVEQFVALVRSRSLLPGTRLPSEREMEDLLGVSRTSYREAVRILETMGILRVVPGRGTWVADDAERRLVSLGSPWLAMHERDVKELFEMREILEVRAVSMAAARLEDGDVRRMEDALDGMREAVATGDPRKMVAADTAFHLCLADTAGNRVLAAAIADLYEHLEETRFAMISIPGRPERMDNEHREIVRSVASRDPDRAALVMADHVRRVEREVVAAAAAGKLSIGIAAPDEMTVRGEVGAYPTREGG